MKTPAPLPPALHGSTFSSAQARESGVPQKRLRAQDIRRIGWGLYQHLPLQHDAEAGTPLALAEDSALPSTGIAVYSGPGLETPYALPAELGTQRLALLRALSSQLDDGARFSHSTAALLLGLPLPTRLARRAERDEVEISRMHTTSSARFTGLVCHRAQQQPEETAAVMGLRISRPGRVLVDLMPRLRPEELVVLGDQLIRVPHPRLDVRTLPWETPDSLAALLRQHPSTDGIVAAREALDLVRVGADSPPETLLRLALMEDGFPEPQLQVRAAPGCTWSGDLGWEEIKVVVQYEGKHHFSAGQQISDAQRDHAFRSAGWIVLHTNAVDMRQGFPLIRRRLRIELRRAGLL